MNSDIFMTYHDGFIENYFIRHLILFSAAIRNEN